MKQSTSTAVASVVIVADVPGCSGEDLAERVVENRIEAESGDDADIDVDDGDISIRAEGGELSIDVDRDGDGNVSMSGSSENGEFSVESDGGETVVETEDGTTAIVASDSGSIPAGFPASVLVPDGLTVQYSQSMNTDQGDSFVVGGTLEGDGIERGRAYIGELESAGSQQVQVVETDDCTTVQYSQSMNTDQRDSFRGGWDARGRRHRARPGVHRRTRVGRLPAGPGDRDRRRLDLRLRRR